MRNKEYSYDNSVHKMGRITLSLGFLASLLPPLMLWFIYRIFPPLDSLLKGIFNISFFMLPVSIVEVLTFAPILGAGAMYMSYLTGNVSNMKIPSAAIAMEAADVKSSTKEGEIVANLAIAGSIIATEIVLVIGVFLLLPLSDQLNNPLIRPAFEQILPALFGSIGAYYILKEWKLAVIPLTLAILLSIFVGSKYISVIIPVCVIASMFSARVLYKKKIVKPMDK